MSNVHERPELELVGLAEAAALLGITTTALSNRRRASGRPPGDWRYPTPTAPVPEPIAQLRCGPIWQRAHIEAYHHQHRRRDPHTTAGVFVRENEHHGRRARTLRVRTHRRDPPNHEQPARP